MSRGHIFVEKASPADNPKLKCVSNTSEHHKNSPPSTVVHFTKTVLFPSAKALGLDREVKSFLLPS